MTRWKIFAAALALGLTAGLAQAEPGHRHHHKKHHHGHPGEYRGPMLRHGAGPHHDWVRGSRIPPHFRSRHYVVNDWRGHRLSHPPRGYHWVQNGSDYLLVAIASGVIAQIILSH